VERHTIHEPMRPFDLFLWQGAAPGIRKELESYYTIWMEAVCLPKRRILEIVMQNVIEMGGAGIYGGRSSLRSIISGVSARAA